MTADGTPTILVIEDDPDVSGLMVEILRQEGYRSRVAGDGLEGLLKLTLGSVDLALLDIMMPDLDGDHVLRQLLEEGGGELQTPIIVMTGSMDAAARCRQVLDPDDVFTKPFDPDEVLARIAHHLGRPEDREEHA